MSDASRRVPSRHPCSEGAPSNERVEAKVRGDGDLATATPTIHRPSVVRGVGGMEGDEMVDQASVRFELEGFSGTLLHPGDGGYDEARTVFNAMVDRRPSVIARCSKTSDVVAVVNFARDGGLPLSVYGGGHGVTGAAVIDGAVC